MKVVWSAWALRQLDEIHMWYSTEASSDVADRIVEEILSVTRLLEQYPFSGQLEPWLAHKKMDHRRVVVSNFKVIYRAHQNEVRIVDVFDSRQDPGRMTL